TLTVVSPCRNRVRSPPVTRSRPQLERSTAIMRVAFPCWGRASSGSRPPTLLLLRRRGRLLRSLGGIDLALDPGLELGLAPLALHLRRLAIVSASHAILLWPARISRSRQNW